MLEAEITQLANAIHQAVRAHKQSNRVASHKVVRIRRRDFSLKYHEDFGFANFPPQRIEEEVWDGDDEERFQEDIVRKLEEYRSLAMALGAKADRLDSFARTLSYLSFGSLDDNTLRARAAAFAIQLEDRALTVNVTAFIDGLSVLNSPLVISDHLTFRHPTPDDLTENVFIDEYGDVAFHLPETWFRVVGDFAFDATHPGGAQEQLLRTVDALRLFRVGGVRATRYRMASFHPMGQGMTLSGGPGHSQFRYTVSGSDTTSLATFLADVVPLLPNAFQVDENLTEWAIAYTRYRDALFQVGPDRVITSSVTALEALFLRTEPELTRRLAQRVSVFLRVLGTQVDGQATFDEVARGYKIRSTFIHGGSLKASDRQEANALAVRLLEYTRQCVLAFLQMSVPKDEILRQLDRTMIDPGAEGGLQASVSHVVHR